VNGNLNTNLKDIIANNSLWKHQLGAIGVTLLLAVVGTVVIAYIVKVTIGLRVDEEVETVGLDLTEHGEEGYTGTIGGSLHGTMGERKPALAPSGEPVKKHHAV